MIGTSDRFKVALINTYDYNNTYASSGISDGFAAQGLYFYSHFKADADDGSNRKPLITVTTEDPVPPTIPPTQIISGRMSILGGRTIIK